MPSGNRMYLHCHGCDARWVTAEGPEGRAENPCPCPPGTLAQMEAGPWDQLLGRSWVCACDRRVWPDQRGNARRKCPYCGRFALVLS